MSVLERRELAVRDTPETGHHDQDQMGAEPPYYTLIACPQGSYQPRGLTRSVSARTYEVSTPFWIGQTPVTQGVWRAVMGDQPSVFSGARRPVDHVSWFDCIRFCNRLSQLKGLEPAYLVETCDDQTSVRCHQDTQGYRLPTVFEWEYAASAGGALYALDSKCLEQIAWYGRGPFGGGGTAVEPNTYPVAQKDPNGWRLYDVLGNVWEWCQSAYESTTLWTCEDPIAERRVIRGGSWRSPQRHCQISYHSGLPPDFKSNSLGFRVCRIMSADQA